MDKAYDISITNDAQPDDHNPLRGCTSSQIDAVTIAAFLKRNLDCMTRWKCGKRSRERLLMWITWHLARLNVCCVQDPSGKLIAVGIARPLKDLEESRFPHMVNEAGKFVFCDHVVAKTNESLKALLRYAAWRFPHAEYISFHRSKNGSALKTYELKKFLQKAKV